MFPKLTIGASPNGHVGPVTARSPRSAAAEAYRTLRTNLQFSSLDRDIRVILITSAGEGEGKSTVAANLAVAAAESGRTVLLVDCDLRRPDLHTFFGLAQRPGLTTALIEQSATPAIQATAIPGLGVLTSGELPPNPGEVVASHRVAQLLGRLRGEFDLVVVDSPPVGLVADAAVLSPHVDGVVLVVSAGKTKRDQARSARQQLANVGANVLGAVLNNARVDRSKSAYQESSGR